MARTAKVRKIGTLKFNDLVPEVAYDVAGAIAAALNERRKVTETYDPEFVSVQGAKAAAHAAKLELDIVLVDPSRLGACTAEVLERPETARYEQAWKEGVRFPPVIVNSRRTWAKMLHEGWHRSCAAARVGLSEIEALDVGRADLSGMDVWLKERQE